MVKKISDRVNVMRWIVTCLLFLILSSCVRTTREFDECLYHDNGTPKPKIALIPVIDNSSSDLPWSVAEELTEAINSRLRETGKFYFTSDFDTIVQNQISTLHTNPFLDDLDWVQEMSTPTEFIVFIELARHKLMPKSKDGFFQLQMTKAYTLDMGLRVKVVDIRFEKPKIILQELVRDTFHIPWRLTSIDYKNSSWSKTAFFLSPIGLAHMQLIKKVTKQIEDYIILSQTNL